MMGFPLVKSRTEIDAFLELSCFFHDPADVGNLISGSSAFSKSSLDIWNFMIQVPLKEEKEESRWEACSVREGNKY